MGSRIFYIIGSVLSLLSSLALLVLLIFSFRHSSSGRLMLLPFIICLSAAAFTCISQLAGSVKALRIGKKIFLGGFVLLWFGFLSYWLYLTISGGNYMMSILAIPFLLAGIPAVKQLFS